MIAGVHLDDWVWAVPASVPPGELTHLPFADDGSLVGKNCKTRQIDHFSPNFQVTNIIKTYLNTLLMHSPLVFYFVLWL